jgi:spore maturation protein CgeB
MVKIRILLVAKPWQGGLSKYIFSALKEHKDVSAKIIHTYPITKLERLKYIQNKKKWLAELIKLINNTKYDLGIFINYLSDFKYLKNSNNNVLWFTDKPIILKAELRKFCQVYLSDMGYKKNLDFLGNFAGELSFAHDSNFHFPQKSNSLFKKSLCSIMNKDIKRDHWLEKIAMENEIPDVYGNYFFNHSLFWKYPLKFHPSVRNKQMGNIYNQYEISLNIHASVVREGTNLRTFECAGYGIPQIIEYRPGLENFFEPEKEILTFSTIDEFNYQYKRLSSDKPLRKRLAMSSRRKVEASHNYKDRVDKILRDFSS